MKHLSPAIVLIGIIAVFSPLAISAQSNNAKTNLAIVQGVYEKFGKGDIPGVLSALDPKVEWYEAESFIYGDNKVLIGPEAVLNGVFMKIGAEWEYITIVNLQVIGMENGMVLGTGRYQGKYKRNGATIDAQLAHVWTLRDGKVIKFQQYTDTRQFSEAIKK
jgi:ketosteroid isomerase-like protein